MHIRDLDLNSIQTIYTIFFAIYYGTTITRTNELSLFDTTAMSYGTKYPKAWLRFGLSFLFINVVPLLYFWYVMNLLGPINDKDSYIDFCLLFIVFIQSIVGFGFYRILVGILVKRNGYDYWFYDQSLYKLKDIPIRKFLLSRPKAQRERKAHVLPGVIWVIITIVLLILYNCLPEVLCGICWLLAVLMVFVVLVVLTNRKVNIDYSASFWYLHLD
jgi:hypothetical protein